jgi:photosystem II stability/assembly factor-like uncharacterized protein
MKKENLATFILLFLMVLTSSCSIYDRVIQVPVDYPNGGRAVAVSVDAGNDKRILVASATGGLFLSANKGVNWKHISNRTSFNFTDVLIVPGTNIMIATTRADSRVNNGGGVWRSTNGGNSWSQSSLFTGNTFFDNNMSAYCISFEEARKRVWIGTVRGIAFSDDYGISWSFINTTWTCYSILSPSTDHLVVSTGDNVHVSLDRGATWTEGSDGLPVNRFNEGPNQIVVSPLNNKHIFWAIKFSISNNNWTGLFHSYDAIHWNLIMELKDFNRPPFLAVSKSISSEAFDLYFGDGSDFFGRARLADATSPTLSSFKLPTVDHVDFTDLGFEIDGIKPLILTGDGGLHFTTDGGANWKLGGSGSFGYNALQINDMAGQQQSGTGNTSSDLYIGTQDNYFLVSGNNGNTWTKPPPLCCEGGYINIINHKLPVGQTKVTLIANDKAKIGDRLLTSLTAFNYPPGTSSPVIGNFRHIGPRILRPGVYLANTYPSPTTPPYYESSFYMSEDNGSTWTPRFDYYEATRGNFWKTANDAIFITIKRRPFFNQEDIGLKKVVGLFAPGTPLVADVAPYIRISPYTTDWGWYYPFTVDPVDPNHIIVPDMVDKAMRVCTDGGLNFKIDQDLTKLVTQDGKIKFEYSRPLEEGPLSSFSQVTAVEYNPFCPGHILVGTRESGIFSSKDNGQTWKVITGSEVIPNITSFYFAKNEVFVSSYGRSVWKFFYKCDLDLKTPDEIFEYREPWIYYLGVRTPLVDIKNPKCIRCVYYLTKGGRIVDYTLDTATSVISEIFIDKGTLEAFSIDGKPVQTNVKVSYSSVEPYKKRPEFLALSNSNGDPKGLLLEGDIFKGFVFHTQDITSDQLPKSSYELIPSIHVNFVDPKNTTYNIKIDAVGFKRGIHLEALINDKVVDITNPVFNDQGQVTFTIPYIFWSNGVYKITVRQDDNGKQLQDSEFLLVPLKENEMKLKH